MESYNSNKSLDHNDTLKTINFITLILDNFVIRLCMWFYSVAEFMQKGALH